ncbi:hypothetical protein [Legionella cardiaca]|uniref:Stress-induced bacterial acidophilic repeat motif protein n=1 Tax=Legionella cardiaca TaxID=1071983 RepID=A0ABY8AW90_9GAMM|nr:hypothetical protein [Legionella cardiaca]WED43701.1 hypothetical protein PXX05_02685 [Legionella cardiaca]
MSQRNEGNRSGHGQQGHRADEAFGSNRDKKGQHGSDHSKRDSHQFDDKSGKNFSDRSNMGSNHCSNKPSRDERK